MKLSRRTSNRVNLSMENDRDGHQLSLIFFMMGLGSGLGLGPFNQFIDGFRFRFRV